MSLRSWYRVAVLGGTAFLLPLLGSCKSRYDNQGGNDSQAIDPGLLRSSGLARVVWACSGKDKKNNQGRNSQEEYCEWTRSPVAFTGKGFSLASGSLADINLPKACVFTTAFDQTRSFFLTQRVVGKPNKFANQSDPFWATQFNSYAFLVGGTEPDTGTFRDGIIGHCITGKSCFSPNCVPDRASDPLICKDLNLLGQRKCQVDTGHKVAPVVTAGNVPSGRMGDQIVKPQLSVAQSRRPSCFFAVDPKVPAGRIDPNQERTLVVCDAREVSDCDTLAPEINVVVEFKIRSTACVGGSGPTTGGTPEPTGPSAALQPAPGLLCKVLDTTPANVRSTNQVGDNIRTQLIPGTEVKIRGFLGDWASVEFDKDGQSFGTTEATRSFINKGQFFDASGNPSCRKP